MRIKTTLIPGDETRIASVRFTAFDVPEDKISSYRKALDGVRYDKELRARVATIDKLPSILRRLREAGLPVHVDTDTVRAMQKRTLQEWFDQKAVQDRIGSIDKEIRRRVKESLFEYQITGAQWLTTRMGALLADEQGLGKTRQAIVALPSNAPAIVLCPAKVKGHWQREFGHCRPHIKTFILEGRDSFRWPREGEVLIMNYEILPNVHDALKCDGKLPASPCPGCKPVPGGVVMGPRGVSGAFSGHLPECTGFLEREPCPGCHPFLRQVPKGLVVMVDEAQKVKSGKAESTKRLRAMTEHARNRGGRTWLITGTPLENEPKDLWSLYKTAGIAEEGYGSWAEFCELFKAKKGRFGYSWGTPDDSDSDEIAARQRRISLRRMKRDVLKDLPPKIWKEIPVQLNRHILQECNEMLEELGGEARFDELLEGELPDFQRMAAVRAQLASAKIPAMLEVVEQYEEMGEPLIVFSAHRAPIELLAKRPGWRAIVGGVSSKEASEIVKLFQAGKLLGVACTIRAAGTGLTLTRSNAMLFVDRDFTSTKNAQAEDRFHRIGQERGVLVMILKANHPLDARVTEITLRKQKFIELGVDVGSVTEEAPKDETFEAQIRAVQAEVACGRSIRRAAESDEEQMALDLLHTHVFPDRADARLAVDLAEEATVVGLSDAQWKLAATISGGGVERAEMASSGKVESDVESQ